jgi:hypothetical protein
MGSANGTARTAVTRTVNVCIFHDVGAVALEEVRSSEAGVAAGLAAEASAVAEAALAAVEALAVADSRVAVAPQAEAARAVAGKQER